MKKFIIIVNFIMLSCIVSAQTTYTDGGVYKIDNTLTLTSSMSQLSLTLHDKAHENDKTPPGWDLMCDFFTTKNEKIVSNANFLRAIRESFTQEQINDLAAKGERISFFITWNHSGDIVDFALGMRNSTAMKSIPVVTYGSLFAKFKQYVKFKVVSPNYAQPWYTAMFIMPFSVIKSGDINLE